VLVQERRVSIDRAVIEKAYLSVDGEDWRLVSFALRRRGSEDSVVDGGGKSMNKEGRRREM
jgi:hypothetical protein